ncbi:hypothetical protein EZS27_018282 [termite gut metagenome]|uniref:Uncharacterized protein n=1 Tax=termite gut metagenome TaxID=433724 RepID=A0A5J4RJG8_9ZZZZ
MLRSNINTEKSDFRKIKDAEHINEVWKIIEKNIPIYFEKMLESEDELAALKANTSFKIQSSSPDTQKRLDEIFLKGLFYKEEDKYKKFFSEESMHEFEDEDDPKAFKSALSTKVPVILKARNSKRETMREWQERFATSKAVDVYAIFFNLIDFMNDYVSEIDPKEYGEFNDINELEKFYILNEDDDYNVPGVIGMGIKSSVLFYLNPTFFLGANKNTLYGYYFLSECEHFHLPSQTNEFIMINDMRKESNRRNNTNMLIDQNYWFPYDLFMLYGLRTYRKLKELCTKHKYPLDDAKRFVHVNTFMSQIWDLEYDKIVTMTGGDQEDAR